LLDGNFPVAVELVVELGLSRDVLSKLKAVGHCSLGRQFVFATGGDGKRLAPKLGSGIIGVVELALVSMFEALGTVVDEATGTDDGLGCVVGEPVLVTGILLNEGDSGLGDLL